MARAFALLLTTTVVRARPRPANKGDLVKREWSALPGELLLNLVHSMPRRIGAVIKAKGGHTK